MSFDIHFKEKETSELVTIGYNEFKDLIEQGKILPKFLIRDCVLTGSEWWTADELNIFHRHSPNSYPLGPRLQKKRELENYWNERREQSWRLLGEYLRGNLIDERYKLIPLPDLIRHENASGVARLYVLRSFEPERIFTLAFRATMIRIEAVQGQTSLWSSLRQVASSNGVTQERCGRPFDPLEIHRAAANLACAKAPEPFSKFSDLEAASLLAPSCSTKTLDGCGFRHRVLSRSGELYAEWHNPSEVEHAPQTSLVSAYRNCVLAANLGRFWGT